MTLKKNLVKGAAVVTTVGAVAALGLVGGSAKADPQFPNAFVGVGSDTTQDVLNALSGYAPAPGLTAAQSRYEPAIASNGSQLLSFNALNPDPAGDTCITTKLGGPAFDRPNGSGNGREALSRAEDGTGWGTVACTGATTADVGGQIDFARSSSGPASGDTGTALTYSVLGRDAVSIAFYRNGVAGNTINPETSTSSQLKTRWTRQELQNLFSNATGAAQPFTADDGVTTVNVLACGIQTGSGTFSFTRGTYNVTTGQEATATSVCTPTVASRLQENDSTGLKAKGDAFPTNQVVVGFSAGAFIGKSNGVASPNPQLDAVGLAAIVDADLGAPVVNLGNAYTGAAPNYVPDPGFYGNSVFGRTVYNVVPTSKIDSALGNAGLKSMFKDPDGVAGPLKAAICEETQTIEQFGFQVSTNCGDTSLKGSFIAGQSN
jgi:hypothetical protein